MGRSFIDRTDPTFDDLGWREVINVRCKYGREVQIAPFRLIGQHGIQKHTRSGVCAIGFGAPSAGAGRRQSSGWQSGRVTRGAMSSHYIAVLVPEQGGGWSVLFPDLPGCATHGPSVHEAITTASSVASAWLAATRKSGDQTPAPRSYEDIRSDSAWALDRGIDWTTAVVSLVRVEVAP